jgi:hypothetical protein
MSLPNFDDSIEAAMEYYYVKLLELEPTAIESDPSSAVGMGLSDRAAEYAGRYVSGAAQRALKSFMAKHPASVAPVARRKR